jgi:hypothetical protein
MLGAAIVSLTPGARKLATPLLFHHIATLLLVHSVNITTFQLPLFLWATFIVIYPFCRKHNHPITTSFAGDADGLAVLTPSAETSRLKFWSKIWTLVLSSVGAFFQVSRILQFVFL